MTTTDPAPLNSLLGDPAELEIAPYRPDGSLRSRVPIWSVSVRGQIAIRSYRGTDGAWYRNALHTRRAHVRAADFDGDVILLEGDPRLRAEIDAAYRSKYASSPKHLVDQIVTDTAAATTLFLVTDTNPLPDMKETS